MDEAIKHNKPTEPNLCDCGTQPVVRSSVYKDFGLQYWVHCPGCKRAQLSRHNSRREACMTWAAGDRGKIKPNHHIKKRKDDGVVAAFKHDAL